MAQRLTTPDQDNFNAEDDGVTIEYITPEEGAALLDRQARRYLGMSGEEFKRRYREGKIDDPGRSDVIMLSLLIPLTED